MPPTDPTAPPPDWKDRRDAGIARNIAAIANEHGWSGSETPKSLDDFIRAELAELRRLRTPPTAAEARRPEAENPANRLARELGRAGVDPPDDVPMTRPALLVSVIRDLGVDIQNNKVAKGWAVTLPASWIDTNQIPADLALIHSEVSEALEAFRKDDRPGFAEELADVLIRVIGLAHGLGIDLGYEVAAKVEKNRSRAFQHGGKRL